MLKRRSGAGGPGQSGLWAWRFSWNLNALYKQGLLVAGHTYRFYVMVHDGDQNKVGGDAGQAAYNYYYPAPPNPARRRRRAVSGFVYADDGAGNLSGFGGVLVTLTGTTASGQQVTLSMPTNADGSYSFGNVQAGTYTITETIPTGYMWENASVGTVNGTPNGSVAYAAISGITLNPGDTGIGYNFILTPICCSGRWVDPAARPSLEETTPRPFGGDTTQVAAERSRC